MPKIIKNFFYESLTFEKMIAAYERARKNKITRTEVMEFDYNLERNIVTLIREIKSGRYVIGKYKEFTVYEPKERIIKSLPFRDRVVHQWFVHEYLIPVVVPRFISDSYACIEGRGTHQAVNRLEYFMYNARLKYGNYYILKMDIKKFFYNINPNILLKILKSIYHDKAFFELCEKLIFEVGSDVGIPIGNYTSQYFANIYLHKLDSYVKHELRIKYYLRFLDDFILLVENKEIAKEVFKKIEIFLNKELELELNHKSCYFPSGKPVDFCGYRVFYTHKLVRNRSKRKMRARIKYWNKLHHQEILDKKMVILSINSWKAHIKHADSYNLYERYLEKMDFELE